MLNVTVMGLRPLSEPEQNRLFAMILRNVTTLNVGVDHESDLELDIAALREGCDIGNAAIIIATFTGETKNIDEWLTRAIARRLVSMLCLLYPENKFFFAAVETTRKPSPNTEEAGPHGRTWHSLRRCA